MSRESQAPMPFRFDEVRDAPNRPGIYAWYHQFSISDADIEAFKERLSSAANTDRQALADGFLMEHIFAPYREADYSVAISGRLKPEYKGQVKHHPRMSEGLKALVAEKSESLGTVTEILGRTVPFFASPIYIGLATKSLRQRLSTHQKLLSDYRENPQQKPLIEGDEDHSFAYEAVCVRHLIPNDLLVYVMQLPVPEDVLRATEYILNRINYPLCGRN